MHATLRVWILSLIICVARGHGDHGDHGGRSPKVPLISPADSSDSVPLLTAANREFAFHLYRSLAAQPDARGGNIFFSPLSVSVALAALAAGARGETHRQLFRGLGFSNASLSQAQVDQAFQSLFEESRKTSNEVTSQGTAVFVDQLFKPQPEFLHTLKQSYFADGFSLDFSKGNESANTINKYVQEKTHGKIEKLVEDLDPSTVLYLISYVYFKGKRLHVMPSRCVCRSSAFTSHPSHRAEAFGETQTSRHRLRAVIARLVYSAEGAVQAGPWTEGGGVNRSDGRELRGGSGEHNVLEVGRGGGTREQQQEVSGSTPHCPHHV